MKVGDTRQHDLQADVFHGEYKLVEDQGNGRWLVEDLAPSQAIIDAIELYYASDEAYLGYHDAFGPDRRRQTPDEACAEEIARRQADAGHQYVMRFVSRDEYAKHF